jgi:hypothetical protein
MIAYKGFNKNIESVMGNGKKESCTFEAGKTYKEAVSKTARIGFHCCENPFDCLTYYSMDFHSNGIVFLKLRHQETSTRMKIRKLHVHRLH